MHKTEDEIKKVIGNVFGIDPRNITNNSSIDTIEEWDSLKHLNLVIALEEYFNVTFSEDETIEILNYPLIKMTLENHGIFFE